MRYNCLRIHFASCRADILNYVIEGPILTAKLKHLLLLYISGLRNLRSNCASRGAHALVKKRTILGALRLRSITSRISLTISYLPGIRFSNYMYANSDIEFPVFMKTFGGCPDLNYHSKLRNNTSSRV